MSTASFPRNWPGPPWRRKCTAPARFITTPRRTCATAWLPGCWRQRILWQRETWCAVWPCRGMIRRWRPSMSWSSIHAPGGKSCMWAPRCMPSAADGPLTKPGRGGSWISIPVILSSRGTGPGTAPYIFSAPERTGVRSAAAGCRTSWCWTDGTSVCAFWA